MSVEIFAQSNNLNDTLFVSYYNGTTFNIVVPEVTHPNKQSSIAKMIEDQLPKMVNSSSISLDEKRAIENKLEYLANQINNQPDDQKLDVYQINNSSLLKYQYGPENTYDNAIAGSLGEEIYEYQSKEIKNIKEAATLDTVGGITVNRKTQVNGTNIDAYRGINKQTPDFYESIGGADLSIFAIFDFPKVEDLHLPKEIQRKEIVTVELDNVLSLGYSTMREKYPVRALGYVNPKAHISGTRAIAGHIAFAIFAEDIISRLRARLMNEYNNIMENFSKYKGSEYGMNNASNKLTDYGQYTGYQANAPIFKTQMLDSLPPFHILAMGTNENGIFSKFLIKNVTIIDENQYQGTQQPNIINKVSYVAEDIVPMSRVNNSKTISIDSVDSIDESYIKGTYNKDINFNKEITGTEVLSSLLNDLIKEIK